MKIQKTAKPSFHDESTVRHIFNVNDVVRKKIITCRDLENSLYGMDVEDKQIGRILLTFDEIIDVFNNKFNPVIDQLARKLVPEGEYRIYPTDVYNQDFDMLTEAYVYKITNREMDFPYGVYTLTTHKKFGIVFKKHFLNKDNKIMISNKPVVQKVSDFFTTGREGRANRMGLLLYGPPGNGKTSSVYDLINVAEELKIRVVLMDSSFPLGELNQFREVLNNERMVFVFEEMTERINYSSKEQILTFLDGENSWNNCVNIATTNYPEDFPPNLVDRPGRFEEFILFDNPNSDQVVQLGSKFGFSEEDSKGLTGLNLSFDYVSYMFSLAKRLGLTPKEAKEQEEAKRARLSSTFKGKMGF